MRSATRVMYSMALRRVVLLLVELGERVEGRDVGVLEIDDVEVGVDRAVEILDLLRVDLGRVPPELDLLLPIVGRVDVAIVGVDEIEPLAEAPVAALERPRAPPRGSDRSRRPARAAPPPDPA